MRTPNSAQRTRGGAAPALAVPLLLAGLLGACSSSAPPQANPTAAPVRPVISKQTQAPAPAPPQPQMIAASQGYLQCVPYARRLSGIRIRGDAHTWWKAAEGRYARGEDPRVGAVIVLRTGRSRGHIATVTGIIDARTILAEHANWLNRGRIHKQTPIRDVSAAGDWSRVRVWYTPGGVWGRSVYPVDGFIYPETLTARAED